MIILWQERKVPQCVPYILLKIFNRLNHHCEKYTFILKNIVYITFAKNWREKSGHLHDWTVLLHIMSFKCNWYRIYFAYYTYRVWNDLRPPPQPQLQQPEKIYTYNLKIRSMSDCCQISGTWVNMWCLKTPILLDISEL